jgi:hypothetical protein
MRRWDEGRNRYINIIKLKLNYEDESYDMILIDHEPKDVILGKYIGKYRETYTSWPTMEPKLCTSLCFVDENVEK